MTRAPARRKATLLDPYGRVLTPIVALSVYPRAEGYQWTLGMGLAVLGNVLVLAPWPAFTLRLWRRASIS